MTALFFTLFLALIIAELLKGLSANGTPPVLQKFSWQMDLAHFMWSNIPVIRAVLVAALVGAAFLAPPEARWAIALGAVPLGLLWAAIYWVFNHYWVGRVKFLPISQKRFVRAAENELDPALQVIGVELDGVAKAYPVNMLFYHHQITDEIAGRPIWVTYCGLCRSGRVYDRTVDGLRLDFTLVGAITFNAVFRDGQTGSWWRQETGQAAKGPFAGRQLSDIPFEQMSLGNWLAKHPDSLILQYDPAFRPKYEFLAKLMNYEASLPGWHRQETPPLVIGVDLGKVARGYDWEELRKRGMLQDELGDTPLLLLTDEAGSSAFVLERRANGRTLTFERSDAGIVDVETGSRWDMFGRCTEGPLAGARLPTVQSCQEFLRAWVSFHPHTDFHDFSRPPN